MRKNRFIITERSLMFAIGGQLFSQAPNRSPRNSEIIMSKVRDKFRSKANNDNEYYSILVENDYEYIEQLLMGIDEFKDLNLSQNEYEKGIKVDDENRSKYSFCSAYDIETSESWRSDFIDLDAFIRNVARNINMVMEYDEDCFLCKHEDEQSDICNNCKLNPALKFNREGNRNPKGKYTFACKYDCFENKYICCEECDKKEDCKEICLSKSSECNLAINRV